MKETDLIKKDIEHYLKLHQEKELLRFTTVGSVDDGKSTLIGRLLFDTNAVYDDQLHAAKKATKSEAGEIDLSLLTDGLKAEREQGITIDVAYRYFTTAKRKFIIADTPGHVQYTRNMATGASTADVAIILIDARLGVLPQSKRHAYIASLLGIPKLVVAINKMDIVNYSREVFEKIKNDFAAFAATLNFVDIATFPVSALKGDNIVSLSKNTPWYTGGSILDYLETTPLIQNDSGENFYFPVQYVLRPNLNFRGYAGQITSGCVNVGDEVIALPSGKSNTVESIVTFSGDLKTAHAPLSVAITLKDEVDISRGDVLVHRENPFHVSKTVEAMVVWMHETPMSVGKQYWIKHATSLVTGSPSEVKNRINIDTLVPEEAKSLELNEIGKVVFTLNRPIVIDEYKNNRKAGAFIIIDRITNATVAAGMICGFMEASLHDIKNSPVTTEEKATRFAQKPTLISLNHFKGDKNELATLLERKLFDNGHMAAIYDGKEAEILLNQGFIVITTLAPKRNSKDVVEAQGTNIQEAIDSILKTCRTKEIFL